MFTMQMCAVAEGLCKKEVKASKGLDRDNWALTGTFMLCLPVRRTVSNAHP